MSRALIACGAALVIAAAAAPGSPTHRPSSFKSYVSCGARGRHADRFCFQGDHPVAVLRALDRAALAYRVCVREQGERRRCRERRTRRPGQPSRTRLGLDGHGRYRLAWFAGGRAVGRDRLVVRRRAAFAIGDSLGVGTAPYLPRALGDWTVEQSAANSRRTSEGLAILRARKARPGAIVFALGTNDDPRASGAFANAISSALALAGPTRCVVVPNIARPPVAGTSYAGYNRALASLAQRRRNLRVVDWVGLVARHRDWLSGDGVHATPSGYAGRARAIAEQVERC